MSDKLRVAQLGLGYWGRNLLRNLARNPRVDVVALCDRDAERFVLGQEFSPRADCYQELSDIVQHPGIDAVSIATPSGLHFDHASQLLQAGKSVFIEKPITTNLEDCIKLSKVVQETGQLAMVGHTYLYNSIVEHVKTEIDTGSLGDIYYAHSQRLNLGMFRHDSDVIWTLAPHDVSIFNYWFGSVPQSVSARTLSYVRDNEEHPEICFAQLNYPNGVSVHLHLSWVDPQKVRRAVIVGSRKMIVYDDVDLEQPVQIYDKSKELDDIIAGHAKGFNTSIRAGDLTIPNVVTKEPLSLELDHFVACVLDGETCRSGIENALEVTTVLDALSRSAKENGAEINIDIPDI